MQPGPVIRSRPLGVGLGPYTEIPDGLKKGLRRRFANHGLTVMEVLALAEVEHNAMNNRTRGK